MAALAAISDALPHLKLYHVLLLLLTLTLLAILIDYTRILLLRRKLPPGPLPWPIVGNTFQLPPNKPWIYFEQLSLKLNAPVLTYWIGRNPTIWLNTAQSASDLFDKRAGIYASRPRMIVFGELSMGQSNIVSMYYGDRWRVHRKLTHMGVGLQHVRSYSGFQNNESQVVALDLLRTPEDYVMHFERYAASVVSIIGFGRRISSSEDPIITEVIAVMQRAAELNVPGTTFPMLLETFPFLARFPNWMAPWKHGLGGNKGRGRNFYYSLAEEAVRKGQHETCYAKKVWDEAPKYGLTNSEIASLTGNLFGAGSDTSSSTLVTFVLACCAFPKVLPAAWEELDRVVGPYRSPSLDDDLPYVRAFVKEVFRWRSVAIIGGQPHAPTQDDNYKGYLIPKGAWVQGNVWAIHHSSQDFPEPDRFYPSRFFPDDALYRPFPNDKGYMTFGWGRRICPGQGLAEAGTFLSVARFLWAFNIHKALDNQGNEIPVDINDYTNGLNMRPQPFPCRWTVRSEEIRRTVESEGKQALEELDQYTGETKYRMSTFYKQDRWEEQANENVSEKG